MTNDFDPLNRLKDADAGQKKDKKDKPDVPERPAPLPRLIAFPKLTPAGLKRRLGFIFGLDPGGPHLAKLFRVQRPFFRLTSPARMIGTMAAKPPIRTLTRQSLWRKNQHPKHSSTSGCGLPVGTVSVVCG